MLKWKEAERAEHKNVNTVGSWLGKKCSKNIPLKIFTVCAIMRTMETNYNTKYHNLLLQKDVSKHFKFISQKFYAYNLKNIVHFGRFHSYWKKYETIYFGLTPLPNCENEVHVHLPSFMFGFILSGVVTSQHSIH